MPDRPDDLSGYTSDKGPTSSAFPASSSPGDTSTYLGSSPYKYPTKKEDKYPYKHYPYKTSSSNELQKKKAESRSSAEWCKLIIKIALALTTVINCLLLFFAVQKAITNHLEVKSVWRPHRQPKVVRAENMLIASSSETCNELARTLLSRDRTTSFQTIVMMMSVCISVAEPHNSGLLGHGLTVFVDAKKKICKQSPGHYVLSNNMNIIEHAIVENPIAAHIGSHTIAPPRHAANLLSMMDISTDQPRLVKELEASLKVFQSIFGSWTDSRFPLSRSLANVATKVGDGAYFSYIEAFKFLIGEDYTPLRQGELFMAEASHILTLDLLVKMVKSGIPDPVKNVTDTLNEKLRYILFDLIKIEGWRGDLIKEMELWQLDMNNTRMIDGKITKINGHSVCSANTPSSSSFVVDALKKYEKEFKSSGYSKQEVMFEEGFYKLVFKTVMDAVKRFRNWRKITGFGINKETSETLERLHLASKKRRKRKNKKTIPLGTHGANMVVVIDVKNQQAVTMVNSLGTSLGSLVSGNKYVANNLLSELGENLDTVGPVLNSLQPIIAFKDGKISLAMAGVGGVLTRTLDLARTIATAALRLFFDVPIEEAITVPLIYPVTDSVEYTPGFPWPELGRISKFISSTYEITKHPQPLKTGIWESLDRAVVGSSDGKEAKGFFYDSGPMEMAASGI